MRWICGGGLALALFAPSAARAEGIGIVTRGETITPLGDAAIGYKHSYYAVFGIDLWTFGGTYCHYQGTQYTSISSAEAAELFGVGASELPKPLLYRVPLGWLIVGPLVALWMLRALLAAGPDADRPELARVGNDAAATDPTGGTAVAPQPPPLACGPPIAVETVNVRESSRGHSVEYNALATVAGAGLMFLAVATAPWLWNGWWSWLPRRVVEWFGELELLAPALSVVVYLNGLILVGALGRRVGAAARAAAGAATIAFGVHVCSRSVEIRLPSDLIDLPFAGLGCVFAGGVALVCAFGMYAGCGPADSAGPATRAPASDARPWNRGRAGGRGRPPAEAEAAPASSVPPLAGRPPEGGQPLTTPEPTAERNRHAGPPTGPDPAV